MLQELFQNIESLGISRDTTFATLVSVSTFALGYILTRTAEALKVRNHLKKTRQLVVAYLTSIENPIETLQTSLKTIAEAISRGERRDLVYQQSSTRPTFLNDLPRVDLFKAFLLGWRGKEKKIGIFNSLQQELDYLRRLDEASKREFFEFTAKVNRYVESFRTQSNQIFRFLDGFLQSARERNVSIASDPFLLGLLELRKALVQSGRKEDIAFTIATFIEPVLELCKTYGSDQRSLTILPSVLEAGNAGRNRQIAIGIYSKYFSDESERLSQTLKTVRSTIKAL